MTAPLTETEEDREAIELLRKGGHQRLADVYEKAVEPPAEAGGNAEAEPVEA